MKRRPTVTPTSRRWLRQRPLQSPTAQAYTKQARTAEYDQSVAGQAISAYTDFMTLYPDDPRVARRPESQFLAADRAGARQLPNGTILREGKEMGRRAGLL